MGSSGGTSFAGGINAADRQRLVSLNKEVQESGVSERTKVELSDQLIHLLDKGVAKEGNTFSIIQENFNKAREGTDPKYKSRIATQQIFNTLQDRPDAQRLRGQILQFGSSVRK